MLRRSQPVTLVIAAPIKAFGPIDNKRKSGEDRIAGTKQVSISDENAVGAEN
jgi:hypothetical protein